MNRSNTFLLGVLIFVIIIGGIVLALMLGNYGIFGLYIPEKAIGLN